MFIFLIQFSQIWVLKCTNPISKWEQIFNRTWWVNILDKVHILPNKLNKKYDVHFLHGNIYSYIISRGKIYESAYNNLFLKTILAYFKLTLEKGNSCTFGSFKKFGRNDSKSKRRDKGTVQRYKYGLNKQWSANLFYIFIRFLRCCSHYII